MEGLTLILGGLYRKVKTSKSSHNQLALELIDNVAKATLSSNAARGSRLEAFASINEAILYEYGFISDCAVAETKESVALGLQVLTCLKSEVNKLYFR